jgi:hypothetical protein
MKTSFGERSTHPKACILADMSLSTGVAYTIDPAYEAEVRDYLGESGITRFRSLRLCPSKDYREKVRSTELGLSDIPS